ncbi:MAG: prepilin-type N-terminal cleavage/methylation domain-containing protein [Patescibacteria group bacterium]
MTINKKKHSHQKGFTLLELLVVIAIIGLISSIAVVTLQNVRAEARDTIRLADMKQIYTALQIYNEKYGEFPTDATNGVHTCGGGAPLFYIPSGYSGNGENFLQELVVEGIMPRVPVDPVRTEPGVAPDYCYGYTRRDPGSHGCDDSRGNYFVLMIKDLETWDGPGQHPSSSGWRCGDNLPWTGFEWAIGAYEN